jgi:hypothetical protein
MQFISLNQLYIWINTNLEIFDAIVGGLSMVILIANVLCNIDEK